MSSDRNENILADVAHYYAGKIREHGQTPRGVDWNSAEGQTLRFRQLAELFRSATENFSVIDLGCGYGAFVDFLAMNYRDDFRYHGYDVSGDMIEAARAAHPATQQACFHVGAEPVEPADYAVASGIFNVRMNHPDTDWLDYIESTLDLMDRYSRRGFAFNCLTGYADEDRKRPDLYYADPCRLFDRCRRRYSRNVALLHDYGLYEFTILVRKEP